MRWEYLFFDLDGTLTDPAQGICGCVRYALEKGGYAAGPPEDYYSWIGPPLLVSFREHTGAGEAECLQLLSLYRERFSTIGLFENEVYPGIPALLRELKAAGRHLAVATGKPTIYSRQILEHFGLLEYFDFVSGISLDSEPLDKGGVIAAAMAELGITDPTRCVMIGDRRHDVEGAKLRGMNSVAVLYGYGSRQEALAAGADIIAETVAELRGVLLS